MFRSNHPQLIIGILAVDLTPGYPGRRERTYTHDMAVVRRSKLACFVVAAAALASCSGSGDTTTLRVFAAASLTDAFSQLETNFEEANPEFDVELNLAGSSSLREQVRAGAPADVFASANSQIVQTLDTEGFVAGVPTVFATNSLVIALPQGNPGAVGGVERLADDDLLVGLCAPAVPCGELAVQTLDAVAVEASVDTFEPDVRALLTKIELGELDVGLVYLTDALGVGDAVESLAIGIDPPLVTSYPVAALTNAPNPEGAAAFVEFVLSEESSQILSDLGFGAPG